jgi:leucyl aminopeptidase (aminopeptidase T)
MKRYVPYSERAQLCLDACLAVKPGEKVLVIGDRASQPLARAMSETALERGADPVILILPDRKIYEKNPPAPVAAAMKEADVIIVTIPPEYGCQLWHTPARQEASRAGARVGLVFPPATWDITSEHLRETRILTRNLTAKLEVAKHAHLTAPGGTDLHMTLQGRPAFGCYSLLHERGETATIPDWGDAEISPLEGTSQGTVVIDGSMTFIGKIKTPIVLTVENGRVTRVEGGKEADRLKTILQGADAGGTNIAEFGIGTVPRGVITGHKDDKLLGTAHIALGHNVTLGGTVDSNIHMDGIIKRPRIELDELVVMDDGVPDAALYMGDE